jgi:hypothetical protein
MAMSKFPTRTKEASNEFLGVLRGGGAPMVECHCGRIHVAPDSRYLTDDEQAGYKESIAKYPDQYVEHRMMDGVDYKCLYDLMPYVIDCPCNSYAPYEKFIWTERATIRKYLAMVKMRLQMELDSVESWSEDF